MYSGLVSTEYNKADRTTRRERKRPLEWTGAREVQTIRVLPIGRKGWTCKACTCGDFSSFFFVPEWRETSLGGIATQRWRCGSGEKGSPERTWEAVSAPLLLYSLPLYSPLRVVRLGFRVHEQMGSMRFSCTL